MFTLIRLISATALKGIGALALGAAILGMVARNYGLREGTAYVHVATPGVVVTVDDRIHHVASSPGTPIVLELPPGPHVLRTYRAGTLHHEEGFVLELGGEIVLVAGEEPAPGSLTVTASARRPRP